MTELEILQRAKMYMDKLANGIDPITDREAPEEDIINSVRLSRCFFYVSDVLRQVIENGGVVGKKPKAPQPTLPFALTYEQARRFEFFYAPVSVTVLAQRINELRENADMKKLNYGSITQFLERAGMLTVVEGVSGKKTRRPTEAGRSLGISTAERTGQNGTYTAVLYDQSAQRFILDNLDAIIEINNAPKEKSETAELP